jgi:hypothetical protein
MKIKFGTFAVIAIAMVEMILSVGCKTSCDTKSPIGGCPLVAKYEPLQLYFYADTASTNKFPDLFVREGDYPVFLRQNTSNGIVTTHFEKGKNVLETDYDNNGNILRSVVEYYNGYKPIFTYVDTNGDGLFDVFITGFTNRAVFVRSNMCWVPVIRKK